MKNLILATLLLISACTSTHVKKSSPEPLPTTLSEAVKSGYRTPHNILRDIYRHPLETLTFFDVRPEMTVVEITPSGGWYTEILAPFLAGRGRYIVADPPADPNGYTTPRVEWMKRHPHVVMNVQNTTFLPGTHDDIAPTGTVDRVLTFRNVHNWENKPAAFNAFFKALKPGGILGVVEHRAAKRKKWDPKNGYLRQEDVINWAKAAGFKLVEKSEINANSRDTTDHPEGVWTLPPRLRLGDKDRAKYMAIGESDRMTLKFIKPL